MFEAVIFDLDGTLVDSLAGIAAAMDQAWAARGLPTHELDVYRHFVGSGVAVLAERATPPQEHGQLESLLAGFRGYYLEHLVARTRPYDGIAALRRRRLAEARTSKLELGLATIDFESHQLARDGEILEMTAQETKLLQYLVDRDGLLLSRQQILDGVWGADYFGTERTVDNFIGRLRAKIEIDPRRPRHIVTVRGAGYRFSRNGQ